MTIAAVLLGLITVWLLVSAPPVIAEQPGTRRPAALRQRWVHVAGVLALVAATLLAAGARYLPWALIAWVAGATVVRLLTAARRRTRTRAQRAEVARACHLLSGQLLIGQVPTRALLVTAEECPLLERAAATQRIGADVGPALRQAATSPGADGLVALAEAWELSERSGAPIVDTVEAVARDQRADQHVRALTDAELAAPRATGRVLAALPLAGIAMAQLVGAQPMHLLFATRWGPYLLVGAVTLASAGMIWMETIADRAEKG